MPQTVVQSDLVVAAGAGATLAVAFGSNIVAGNAGVAGVSCNGAFSVTGVSGTQSGVYTQGLSHDDTVNTGHKLEAWHAQNVGGGADTVTATFSPSTTSRTLHIVEVAGMESVANPVDNTAVGNGNGTAMTTSAFTPSLDGCLLFGFSIGFGSGGVAQAPFAQLEREDPSGSASEYVVQGTATSQGATFTQSVGEWACILVAYKPGEAGPPSVTYRQNRSSVPPNVRLG